jgi:methionine-rich copper-binding protein CopC
VRRLVVSAVLAGFAVLGLATPAFAHNVLVGSQPVTGATLSTGPTQVRLDFNAPVQRGPDVITVLGPDGSHWERTENATVTGNSVSTPVAPLGPAGTYTVGYRIISADGHPVSGEVSFTLSKAGTGKPVTPKAADGTSAASAGGSGGGVPVWVWIIGAVVVLGVGLFLALRSSGGTEDDQA